MITVSKIQMQQMEPIILKPFLKSVEKTVLESCERSISSYTPEEIRSLVQQGYNTSKYFGLKSERGITRFICLQFILGQKFYAQKEFLPLFKSKNYRADRNVNQLYAAIEKELNKNP